MIPHYLNAAGSPGAGLVDPISGNRRCYVWTMVHRYTAGAGIE
jgi:hypothetical protein